MSIWKKKLSLLLMLQILLAGGLWAWSYHESAQSTRTQDLLAFDTSEVTKVKLLEQNRSFILSREEGKRLQTSDPAALCVSALSGGSRAMIFDAVKAKLAWAIRHVTLDFDRPK